ncbi:MAG: hypothetical protein WC783_03505 [Candidatus Paceibacterota bacterium]|jgi:hypothetical protein
MGISGSFNLPPENLGQGDVVRIKKILNEEEEKIEAERMARERNIKKLVADGMTEEDAEAKVDKEIIEKNLADFEKFQKMYPPDKKKRAA